MTSLKKMREKAGLSQLDMAIMSDTNVRTIQHYEQGRKNVDGAKLITLLKISKVLHCRIADIVNDEDLRNMCIERNI